MSSPLDTAGPEVRHAGPDLLQLVLANHVAATGRNQQRRRADRGQVAMDVVLVEPVITDRHRALVAGVQPFRAKMDLVPGIVTYFWLTPTQKGNFDILCAELCGTGHSQMRGTVVVEDQASYEKWLADQMSFGQMMADSAQGGTRVARADADPSKRVGR